MSPLSRRDFLKMGLLSLGTLAFTSKVNDQSVYEDCDLIRVAISSISIHKQPSDESSIVGQWYRDDVVKVYGKVTADTPAYNPVWYRVWGGYIHRARLQPVRLRFNLPLDFIPTDGLLAEVTIPFSQAYHYNQWDGWQKTYRLYYQSVHWIKSVETGPDGTPWYRILDELDETTYVAPASHFRIITQAEIAPISPEVPFEKKRIHVNLTSQVLTAYEYDQPVFRSSISSGLSGISLSPESTHTPLGDFNILVKLPSKHMGVADLAAAFDDYVLPGVPWATFFTERGHAFHGVYWHDNYGVPMSHGCINMRPEDAKWIFRWTRPSAGYDEIDKLTLDRKGYGTLVQVRL